MKIEGQHREGCYALEHVEKGFSNTPWAFLPTGDETSPSYGERFRGDRRGRRKGNRRMMGETWFRICCNDPDCKAMMLVSENEILELLVEVMSVQAG